MNCYHCNIAIQEGLNQKCAYCKIKREAKIKALKETCVLVIVVGIITYVLLLKFPI